MSYGTTSLKRFAVAFGSALALVMMATSVSATKPVTGAVSTTDNVGWLDSYDTYTNSACLNHGPINCNIYADKRDVWLSGLPDSAHLNDGTYFFAILVPGGQQDPNDGASDNLSSPWDAFGNRTFTMSAGVISYTGSHDFDATKNLLQAFPYNDTTNPGGEYILAVCQYDPNGDLSGSPGVDPSSCKYDAFKITGTECVGDDCNGGLFAPPTITKDAAGSYVDTFTWGISKQIDKTTVNIIVGTSATFNYTVGVTRDAGTVSNVGVTGTIEVLNPSTKTDGSTLALNINGVTDQLSDSTACNVTNGGPQALTQFATDFAYSCSLTGLPSGQLDNTATVSWPEQGSLPANSASFSFTNVPFTANLVDDCVDVTDTYAGDLGTICASKTFSYSRTLPAPAAGTCVNYNNTATFTSDDTGATGSSSQTATVCGWNAALTPGYWKNHAAKTGAAGCSTLRYSSCSSNGPWEGQYLPQFLGSTANYLVDTIQKADPVWGGMNCGSSTDQGAVGCLAGHLLAAKFNRANKSLPCIDTTIGLADAFLVSVNYVGPGGTYGLNATQRSTAISLKSTLDAYNNYNTCPGP